MRPEVALTSPDVPLGPRCIQTGGRVKPCAKTVPTLAEPHTFVRWVLKEEHSHQTFGQWRRPQSDGKSGLSSGCDRTQPFECYATTAHVTASAVGVCWHHPQTEHVRLELCHQWFRTWLRFTKSLLGFLVDDSARVGTRSRRGVLSAIVMEPLKIGTVPLGASQIPTHKPPRRCVAVV